jgi:deoxyhypusine monooxygenase
MTMPWTIPPFQELQSTLMDPTSPIGKRMRAAYYAKQMFLNLQKKHKNTAVKVVVADEENDDNENNEANNASQYDAQKHQEQKDYTTTTEEEEEGVDCSDEIVNLLCDQVFVKDHGSLLRHEFAYVLGQMQTTYACRTLEELLLNDDDCVMVRHEAAEALGAIGSPSSKHALEVTRDKYRGVLDELSDTCLLALNRIDYVSMSGGEGTDAGPSFNNVGCACMLPAFSSVDPVAPDPNHVALSTEELGDILLGLRGIKNNDSDDDATAVVSLMERYRAMFSLRNRGGIEAVVQLCRTLTEDTSSPLLRHEVAFVLGQLQHPASVPALEESLSRPQEHTMVRHESAEALGAIDGTIDDWNRIEKILLTYQQDSNQAVAESCVVALDAADYWGHCSPNDNDEDDLLDDIGMNTQQLNKSTTTSSIASSSFGKQKHQPLDDEPTAAAVSGDDIRRYMLSEHFNVAQR